MGTEPGSGDIDIITDHASLETELDSEDIAFVNNINTEIADLIEGTPAVNHEYILGDISDYSVSSNGHGHFDLVHEGSSLHCVIFRSRLDGISKDIEEGTLAAVSGDISYYENEGSVSVLVRDIIAVGQGIYQQTYQENKQTLAESGYLDDAAKQPLPDLPTQIGIATSGDSDARQDAVTSIHDYYPDIDITIQDTSVQGNNALVSLIEAINHLDDDPQIELIILTRGGGAEKHLRVFNEIPLCRVIHETTTPIVVGVGHENDRTLAEAVADKRVMTPTEVGNVIPEKNELLEEIERLSTDLDRAYNDAVEEVIQQRYDRLDSAYERQVSDELRSLSSRLDSAYDAVKQQKEHEREKAEVIKPYKRTIKRQRLVITILIIALATVMVVLFI
ncbi:exodeoxyribonuclease VII large subunit [Haloquadratum walsbyi]|jgi:Exonuclease VII, large subunit|uniref:Exodeoxyribonuclease VII, large subunit n=1 Tax=Haloquadratum walsbyi J07HQW2 TaxID=1238425 RepID=U1NIQ9_9EURY|nr:exodeoxyribonuclease VII large subunit [Haloquadratum walsbyi]ERG97110.1 MAG: exodeoxyribonuclease VII, large subunit [Haloquadratum walsbyi J07HQW2]